MEIKIKSITEEEILLEGYGIIFDSVDLHDESFTRETDLMLENVKSVPFLWEHNLQDVKSILGLATPVKTDDVGVMFEIALRRSNKYAEVVRRLVNLGRLGLSTGALPQTVEKDGNVIKRWQVCELSGTVTPAEFRTLGLREVKAIEELMAEDLVDEHSEEILEDMIKAESSPEGDEKPVELPLVIIENVEVEVKPVLEDIKMDNGNDEMKSIQEQLGSIMAILDQTKAAKAGYITADGGAADANIKSFGDWLMAVKRNDVERLTKVYKSMKDLGEGSGTAGGYLVPEQYMPELLSVSAMQSQIYSRVRRVPVSRESGTYPALDQYITPTAGSGQTAFAGGVTAPSAYAGTTMTETEPKFKMLQWRVSKVGGITEVENELVEDSPFAIEALLRGLFAIAIAARNERNILRGSGEYEPLGILNAACAVGVSDKTTGHFNWEDVGGMFSHFKGVGGSPVWIMHPSVWADVMVMANGSDAVWQNNIATASPNQLNGFPILTSEHMPQLGQTGSVLLADLAGYLFFERAGLSIAYSDQAAFTSDKGTWRFKQRADGKPWLLSSIKLADPQGSYSVSPFVYLTSD